MSVVFTEFLMTQGGLEDFLKKILSGYDCLADLTGIGSVIRLASEIG